MNSLLRSHLLLLPLAFIGIACTTTNITNVTNPAIAPIISRFSPDTAWTLKELWIYGTNFGYDAADVRVTIDTARLEVELADDTVLKVIIPEGTPTGLVRVRTYEQTATSAKPVTIRQTFHPHAFTDSLPEGASFSILGSGMNNYRGTLHISVNGISFPVDSFFADRIVSHVVPNSYSGAVTISDSQTSFTAGMLFVTRPSSWNTLSQIWNRATGKEYHHLSGYINGPTNPIDSTWQTIVTYDRQIDMNVSGIPFIKTARGLSYTVPYSSPNGTAPLFQLIWDFVGQTASVTYTQHSITQLTPYHTIDTEWQNGASLPASGSVAADVEFAPLSMYCRIIETTTDSTGLVNLQETTTLSNTSGEFDLILKR